MESLNTFESEMETDGQGHYSLFPALDHIATLSGASETLERWMETIEALCVNSSKISHKHFIVLKGHLATQLPLNSFFDGRSMT